LPHLWAIRRSCRLYRRGTDQIAQADQVVGDHVQAKHRSDLFGAAQLELGQPAPLFDPAKHLLNPAAGVDLLSIALVACGAAINGRTTRSVGVLATWGVIPIRLSSATMILVSYVLSVPRVFLCAPGSSAAIAFATSRSPVPVACVTTQSRIRAWRLSMSTCPASSAGLGGHSTCVPEARLDRLWIDWSGC
jgi:hypothetical protein